MARQKKGSVGVENHRGMLRLRLPRWLYNGVQNYIYLGIPDTPVNRQAAEEKARAIASDIAFDKFDFTLAKYRAQSIVSVSEGMPLDELWQEYTNFKTKILSLTTIDKDFKRIANHIAALPSKNLKDARHMRKTLIDSFTTATAKKVLMQLNACCDWAVGEGLININPFSTLPKIKTRQRKPDISPFTESESELICKAFADHPVWNHYSLFVKFLFLTGCRTSEATGLQWKHIAIDLSTITFSEALVLGRRKDTKTYISRTFPCNDQLQDLLKSVRPANLLPDDPVFKSQEGLLIDAHNFLNRAWRSVVCLLPIVYRPQYNTRHTFITLCLQRGVQVTQIAQWVGNSPRTIWEHYAGLISCDQVPFF